MRLKVLSKLRERLFTRKVNGVQIPREWIEKSKPMENVTEKASSKQVLEAPKGMVILEKERVPRKLHIPKMRQTKRVVATVLLILNFIFAQGIMGSVGSNASFLYVFFMLNAFIILDYIYKTRKRNV